VPQPDSPERYERDEVDVPDDLDELLHALTC
jgi:hypothetical protein